MKNKIKEAKVPGATTMAGFLAAIDFKMLKGQKHDLIKIMDKVEKQQIKITDKQYQALEGILNLIDAIQDVAVDEYGYEKQKVFKLSKQK